ncbi:MAG TPA: DNA repair protein RecO [Rhizomicrobium sp.]|jgi:DNA repair protein RecO (recombination protein O)
MDWSDDAIVLSVRQHGESARILDVLTREHGRHSGLVRSRKSAAVLQPGNTVQAHWRARLSEHLGNFTVEPVRSRSGDLMEKGEALIGLNAFVAIAIAVLPEREAHAPVFAVGEILLDAMMEDGFAHWGPLFVRWEAGLLEALGFGLDLSRCAATGSTDDLRYVSPRSGRAVSGDAGAPYKERLFALPGFLLGSQNSDPSPGEIAEGLRLTGHFLLERVLSPHGREMPAARQRLDALASRESQ